MRLAKYLEQTSESQSAFAERAGLSQPNVSRIVLGGGVGADTARKIIEATHGLVGLEDLTATPREVIDPSAPGSDRAESEAEGA